MRQDDPRIQSEYQADLRRTLFVATLPDGRRIGSCVDDDTDDVNPAGRQMRERCARQSVANKWNEITGETP